MTTKPSFYFYDLETSGADPARQRIMQFAGRRTDMEFQPLGEPINCLIALSEDVLPEPDAILVNGITPQKTRDEGLSEADFLRLVMGEIEQPETTVLGFNNIQFDDEMMRYTLYRNFYDPYEWQWKDGRSRWDVLGLVRMTRALRPDGINWPFDKEGKATNRLELLTTENKLDHQNAHDAMSDVDATIAVARLIKEKQAKLFDYLFSVRSKQGVARVVNLDDPKPFVYTAPQLSTADLHTTIAYPLAPGAKPGTVLVYDLRQDPEAWAAKSIQELKDIRFANYATRHTEGFQALPVNELTYTKCPTVAPAGVLDEAVQQRLHIHMSEIERHLAKLIRTDLADKMAHVFAKESYTKAHDVDAKLYDGFFDERDKSSMRAVRSADGAALADFHPEFSDARLDELLLRYKARNYPKSLSHDEAERWEQYRVERITADLPKFMARLQYLATHETDDSKQYLLQELQLWAESIAPLE